MEEGSIFTRYLDVYLRFLSLHCIDFCLVSTYYVPSTIPRTKDTAVNKRDKSFCFMERLFEWAETRSEGFSAG